MIYFDAAYIAKCYLNEPGAEKVIGLAATSEGICSCEFGRLEFVSVLHRHLREGQLTKPEVSRVLRNFEQDEEDHVWHWLPVTSALIRQACNLVRMLPKGIFLRTVDSLHLSCARENGFEEVFTNDRHMLACASHFGLMGRNVLTDA